MSNLILTIIHSYDYPFVEPFFESLKGIGFKGDLVVFTSETVSKATKKALVKNGATLINYNSAWPYMPDYADAFKNILPDAAISNYRFVLYRQFLLDNQGKYKNIMLTDVRDVIFQKDPFKELHQGKINFFLEDSIQTFRYSELNYQWCSAANGTELTDRIIDNVVSCAGFTIGDIKPIMDYLQHIQKKLEFRDELPWAFDQGIHNGYVYDVKPAEMQIFTNDDPFVVTMGAYQPYKLNSANEVVNSQGETYSVVHQYDRSGRLFAIVKERYIGSRLKQKLKRLYYAMMP